MPSLSGAVSIYCSLTPVNLRRPFDGLPGLVRPQLGHDPPDGGLCVFLNRSLRMVKVLCREGDGLSIWSRRLGRGQFSLPRDHAGNIRLETREPQGILAGIRPQRHCRRHSSVVVWLGLSLRKNVYIAHAREAFRQWGV